MIRSRKSAPLRVVGVLSALLVAPLGIDPSMADEQQYASLDWRNLPPVYSDTAGTVFDIIQVSDPGTFKCLEDLGRGDRQIWDKRINGEPVVNAFLFQASYTDGTSIEVAINPEFETFEVARSEALRYARPLGQLPTSLRSGIKRFSVHKGRKGYHAGTGQIVVYADTTDNRLGYDHLEESLFHEAVHASWDAEHRLAPAWIDAQKRDGRFLSKYARNSPEREDLAETALFAFAIPPPSRSFSTR